MLGELLEFVGLKPNFQVIRKAIEDNTLQRMRAKEDRAKEAGEQSILLGDRKSVEEESRFVRTGSVGGWRGKLTPDQVKLIEQYAGETLAAVGYEPGLVEQPVLTT
jgi:hypothetical protein